MKPAMMRLFRDFLCAREAVREQKEAGKPRPWTTDPILAKYRFCNVNREHDTVTKFIRGYYETVRNKVLWFNLIVARLFNNPVTLYQIGIVYKDNWDIQIRNMAEKFEREDIRIFNPAYIVSTNGKAMAKVPYLIKHVLRPLTVHWQPSTPSFSTCREWADWLLQFNGLGDFMVNQIVTDMKYTTLLPRGTTKDWTAFVMAGPGTKRGLNRLWGSPTKASITRGAAINALVEVRDALADHPLRHYFDDLNNLSNSFCEFDKWCRVETGEGKPKQLYKGL